MQTMNSSIDTTTVTGHRSETIFQTTDIDVAAYLNARAYPLLRIDQFGNASVFTFSAEAALGAEAFYQGASVSAKVLLHAARRLESRRNNQLYEHHFA
jgi:hypothetical protein